MRSRARTAAATIRCDCRDGDKAQPSFYMASTEDQTYTTETLLMHLIGSSSLPTLSGEQARENFLKVSMETTFDYHRRFHHVNSRIVSTLKHNKTPRQAAAGG